MDPLVMFVAVTLALSVGIAIGGRVSMKDAADQATSNKPNRYWTAALIDAEARKKKKEIV